MAQAHRLNLRSKKRTYDAQNDRSKSQTNSQTAFSY